MKQQQLSFSSEVKNELARLDIDSECCAPAELAALLWTAGTLSFGGQGRIGIKLITESASVARRAIRLLKKQGLPDTEVVVNRLIKLKKRNSYEIRVLPSALVGEYLQKMGILNLTGIQESPGPALRRSCCRKAWLRGSFLGGGSINRPEVEYHLELVTGNESLARTWVQLLKSFSLPVGQTVRKEDHVVYLKEGDAVTSFLGIVGAHNALMAFENVRVVKDMRNQVNRLVNCETANLAKTVNASVRQTENIRFIAEQKGLQFLPAALRQAAELRLSLPEATLQELVDAFDGKITRSGMNHRLRSLERIAEDLRGGPVL